MEDLLKQELQTETLIKSAEAIQGWISLGQAYKTDHGDIFVKINGRSEARNMFNGEMAGLKAICSTGTVRVPKPLKVLHMADGNSLIVLEYLNMRKVQNHQALLGEQIARLHLHNAKLLSVKKLKESSIHKDDKCSQLAVDQFGFDVANCQGFIPQDNSWQQDWPTFFIRNRIQPQMDLIEKNYHDREARDLWEFLLPHVSKLFEDTEIVPALLHGDLHDENVGEMADGSGTVIFDPAVVYGHGEFELSIGTMFGGFTADFTNAYHRFCPKQAGFEHRSELYKMFNYTNLWNHFGTNYRDKTIETMKNLVQHFNLK